jgi:hypothetical protein
MCLPLCNNIAAFCRPHMGPLLSRLPGRRYDDDVWSHLSRRGAGSAIGAVLLRALDSCRLALSQPLRVGLVREMRRWCAHRKEAAPDLHRLPKEEVLATR